jgi:hypothetical protein
MDLSALSAQNPDTRPRLNGMPCTSCGSENLRAFKGEIAIRFPELEKLGGPPVWVFPELVVCLACDVALFSVARPSQPELIVEPALKGVVT